MKTSNRMCVRTAGARDEPLRILGRMSIKAGAPLLALLVAWPAGSAAQSIAAGSMLVGGASPFLVILGIGVLLFLLLLVTIGEWKLALAPFGALVVYAVLGYLIVLAGGTELVLITLLLLTPVVFLLVLTICVVIAFRRRR